MRRRFFVMNGSVLTYTSSTQSKLPINPSAFNTTIKSHTYDEVGLIKFNGVLSEIISTIFNGTELLLTCVLPIEVTKLGDNIFSPFINLTSITIGDSVKEIGDMAFYGCQSLTSIYCKTTLPPTLDGSSVFDFNGSGRKIYVPYQSLDAYKTATYWSKYAADIVGYDFENDTVVGGSKQVNTITLRPYIAIDTGASSLSIDYNALFPISSEMIISITTNGVEENCSIWLFPGDQIGTKTEVDLEPSSSEITVTSIDPQEDDNYIYEVVVEYE